MQTVLITGANRGIGFEAARQIARLGHFVYLGSRDAERGRKAQQALQGEGLSHVVALALDVTDETSIREARRALEARSPKLDVLVNNAGIRGDIPQLASKVTAQNLRDVFETNFFGLIRVTQEFLPLLERAEAPVIVNVTSDLGSLTLRSDPRTMNYKLERAAYGPSKTAVNAYTVALLAELGNSKFKVNCVNPGHTATAFNDFKGTKPVERGAAVIVKYALLGEDGPTGKYFSEEGETPW